MSEDRSTYSPYMSTGTAAAAKVAGSLERIRAEMGSTWRQDDQLIEKFFPLEPSLITKIKMIQERNYNAKKCRWKRIPSAPQTASALFTPLRTLMNDILLAKNKVQDLPGQSPPQKTKGHPGQSGSQRRKRSTQKKESVQTTGEKFHRHGDPRHRVHLRRILATHAKHKRIQGIPHSPIFPSLYLAGSCSDFFGISLGPVQATGLSGMSPIEIVLESDVCLDARDRLAVNVSLMFCSQSHRRFAFGLIMTETTCTVYMFDHSGAVASRPLYYHQQPAQFCAIIYGIGTHEAERAGFDNTVFTDEKALVVRTLEVVEGRPKAVDYGIRLGLFRFDVLVGRGTVCWLGSKLEDLDTRFVIKDAWIPREELPGRESEGSLLRHVQAKGIVTGVVQLHHSEEVRRGEDPDDLDTVLRNRKVDRPTPEDWKLDRVHTRIVMKTYGKPLVFFDTRKELLLAFYDTILAHRKLHDVAGILHRDISPGNILINPDGVEGDRGILIDFDHAIRVRDMSPYSTKKRIGTWRYMSRNVLNGEGPHTYLDDLESFYYVLSWILTVYTGPGKPKGVIPNLAAFWDRPNAANLKGSHFSAPNFELPVDPWFGSSLKGLANRLFLFFRVRRRNEPKPLFALNPSKDYDEFLSHVQRCVTDMEAEDLAIEQHHLVLPQVTDSTKSTSLGRHTPRKQSRDWAGDVDETSSSQAPRRVRRIRSI